MNGLMQELPLNIAAIVRHAERMHGGKTVATRGEDGVRTASYRQVLERARRLVSALRSLGVGPDDRVATLCWNHQQHLEAYVGVPCLGAVLHTLNLRLFPGDLAYIVEHAQDKVVIVDRSLLPLWEKVAPHVRCVQRIIVVPDVPGPLPAGALDYEALVAAAEPLQELPELPESQAASLCYTSGTTGHPKGVLYSHRSQVLHSYAAAMGDIMGLREDDVVLPIVPMFHANAWGLPYTCLMVGAELVMPGRFMTPDALTALLVERQVTVAAGVPTIWQGMLPAMKQARAGLGRLRALLCGGSAVPAALQSAYRRELGLRICHAWGMTETSPLGSLCRPLGAHRDLGEEALDELLASQGRVPFGIEIRIVGEGGVEQPWDGRSRGEIQVRGNWVAAGYFNDDTSSEKFAGGWLHTGDVATIDEDGYVRIVDRTKDLIKSGGEWISSVELEGLIMAHPDVAEAAVVAVPHPRWCERPLACVVPRPEARERLVPQAILDHLRDKVARWWIPDEVVFVEQVPKTSVGKFDKKALRERFKDHVLPTAAAPEAGPERPPAPRPGAG